MFAVSGVNKISKSNADWPCSVKWVSVYKVVTIARCSAGNYCNYILLVTTARLSEWLVGLFFGKYLEKLCEDCVKISASGITELEFGVEAVLVMCTGIWSRSCTSNVHWVYVI